MFSGYYTLKLTQAALPMHVLFCHDTFYTRDAIGQVYAYGAFPHSLWRSRYLLHFKGLSIIGREKSFTPTDVKALDVSSGAHVNHTLLPNINSPLKRLLCGRKTFAQIKAQVAKADAVIIRGPAEFGMMAAKAARQLGKPYAVEMSGCAFENVWYHGSLIGKLYAPLKYLRARTMVRHADQVLYVTEKFLQNRYPTNGHREFASNVEIETAPNEVLEQRLNQITTAPQKITFGMIGNFNNSLKGLNTALTALSKAKPNLPHFELRLLGQGDAAQWKARINDLNLNGRIVFSGTAKGGQAVLDWLDDIDIYLQPSFHEGLPRALIEAMSRGCPALASNAGGITELLPPAFIHQKGDAKMLAKHIIEMAGSAETRTNAARDNFVKAQDYTSDKLTPRRAAFWARFAKSAKDKAA